MMTLKGGDVLCGLRAVTFNTQIAGSWWVSQRSVERGVGVHPDMSGPMLLY